MKKIAELYNGAKSGNQEDLDLVLKLAYVFGEENAVKMFQGVDQSTDAATKTASEEKPRATGIISVIKSAGAGSEADLIFLEKLAELDSIGIDGLDALAKAEEQRNKMASGIGFSTVLRGAILEGKDEIEFINKIASIEEVGKEGVCLMAQQCVDGETEKVAMRKFVESIIAGN